MKFKEIKELVKVFDEPEYDDYDFVFWDYVRQKKMDGHFGSFSHPEKEITIPISVVGEKFTPRVKVDGMPEIIPSPFVEGKNAYLHEEKDYELSGVKFTRYFYECEETGNKFGTTVSETFTMCEYYCEECKRLRRALKDSTERNAELIENRGLTVKEVWDRINAGVTEQ